MECSFKNTSTQASQHHKEACILTNKIVSAIMSTNSLMLLYSESSVNNLGQRQLTYNHYCFAYLFSNRPSIPSCLQSCWVRHWYFCYLQAQIKLKRKIFSCSCTNKHSSAWIFKQSMEARNRVGIGLSFRPARLHSLAELVPWNRFLGSLKV